MKLRNKKTGEIFDLDKLPTWLKETFQVCANFYWRECELYEPDKPLIKDKKIREAVRTWADANDIKEIIIFDCRNGSPYVNAGNVEFAENAGHLKICFRTEEQFDTDRIYTVNELCGEEE